MNKDDNVTLVQISNNRAAYINNRTGHKEQSILVNGNIKSVSGNSITVNNGKFNSINTYKFKSPSVVNSRAL